MMPQNPIAPPPPRISSPARSNYVRQEHPQDQINRFSGKLEQLQKRDSQKPDEKEAKAEKKPRNPNEPASQLTIMRKLGKNAADEREAKYEAGFAMQSNMVLAAEAKPALVKAAPAEPPPEHLDRIAAAIAELSGKDIDMRFQLNLPFGAGQVDTALIGRDAMGRLTVQLASNAVLPPEVMTKMSNELARRLRERKLRIGDVGFLENDQPVQPKQSG